MGGKTMLGRQSIPTSTTDPKEVARKARQREYNRRHYEKHREEYLAKQRAAYHADIENSRAYSRSYAKSYRQKHREEINAQKRALYHKRKQAQQATEMGGGQ